MIGGEVFGVLVLFGIVAWAWREQVRNPNINRPGQCEDWLAVRRDYRGVERLGMGADKATALKQARANHRMEIGRLW